MKFTIAFTSGLFLYTSMAAAETILEFTVPRIITDFKCTVDFAIHCWSNGRDLGVCNATEGLVTNDYFIVQTIDTWNCEPGKLIGIM